MPVPYTFGSATTSIPLSQLDSNFATPVTIGSSTVALGNTVTSLAGLTSVTTTGDSSISGLTVGKGGGSVAGSSALGNGALSANSTGQNTAGGYQSLYSVTTGTGNTAFGNSALKTNTANYNNAFGENALVFNTTGANNNAFGTSALQTNTTGGSNTAVGMQSLYSNTTASNNTAVGYQAGYASTGGYNTLFGAYCGNSISTGQYNTFIGPYGPNGASGAQVTSGSKNTIIGAYTGNQGGLNITTSSNYIVLSDGDGNPSAIRDNNDAWYFGIGTGGSSGVVTLQGLAANNNGPLFVGATGAKNAATNQWFIGSNSQIKGGTTYSTLTCSAGGLAGGVNLTSGSTAWASASDVRLKNVTGTYTNALADISQIQPVKFTWKDDIANTPCVGVIAQSVQEVVPEAIDSLRHSKEDETDYLGVRYTELIPLMIASIQELKALVDAQATEIAELKAKVA